MSPSALAAALALVLLAGVAARLAVVLAVAVVAFVGIGREPVAGVGPGGVDGRGRARGDRECAAGVVFGAGGGGGRRWNTVAELLGRDGIRIRPKATLGGAGFGFGLRVGGRGVVLLVMPREPCLEHFEIGVLAIDEDRAEDALVAVALRPDHAHLAVRDETGEELPRGVSECLFLLWRVNPVKADFVLGFGGVEDRERIAVGDLHHAAHQTILGHILGATNKTFLGAVARDEATHHE